MTSGAWMGSARQARGTRGSKLHFRPWRNGSDSSPPGRRFPGATCFYERLRPTSPPIPSEGVGPGQSRLRGPHQDRGRLVARPFAKLHGGTTSPTPRGTSVSTRPNRPSSAGCRRLRLDDFMVTAPPAARAAPSCLGSCPSRGGRRRCRMRVPHPPSKSWWARVFGCLGRCIQYRGCGTGLGHARPTAPDLEAQE